MFSPGLPPGVVQRTDERFSLLSSRYLAVRDKSRYLCASLSPEDVSAQSMPETSPVKWHLAHTSWFFETFVLEKYFKQYKPLNAHYRVLFNSYYNNVGEQYLRPQRGLITRPGLMDVIAYRAYVDEHMLEYLNGDHQPGTEVFALIETGLNHEQQHQELMMTDVKHLFSFNPLHPVYRERKHADSTEKIAAVTWIRYEEDLHTLGYSGNDFAFDNEGPPHKVWLPAFEMASRPVTNSEYIAFIEDKAYQRAELWLSDAWVLLQREHWEMPLYWRKEGDQWFYYTLMGYRQIDGNEPVCHLSYYEADAYARWVGARLPLEQEWEIAAITAPPEGVFLENEVFHPSSLGVGAKNTFQALFGSVWEWTMSPYMAYPGYRPSVGELMEYNGKFMCSQMVLRGGSCVTPKSHIRPTYRNFFFPHARWQFSGLRLARDGRV